MNNQQTYYDHKQQIMQVDKNDMVIGKYEKWRAHKEAILHRGFTVVIQVDKRYILQHRKHPLFDKVYDLSFSSHQIYLSEKERFQTDKEGITDGLTREWMMEKKDIPKVQFLGKFYYKAQDQKSLFYEHEIDYIYLIKVNILPKYNPDFAYGFELVSKQELIDELNIQTRIYAPWVNKIIPII